MCTVSYIPTDNGFYLTSNRDEDPSRKTLPPRNVEITSEIMLRAPIDEEKGGSWIATNSASKVACLLNGGFEKHKRKLPYAKSRGHLVFDAFKEENFLTFIDEVHLENIEPFTLILVDDFLQVLVWDGEKKHVQFLSKNIPHLWSSSTLYNQDAHNKKLDAFNTFLKTKTVSSESILELHGIKNENAFVLNSPQVKTVSTTQVINNGKRSELMYFQKEKNNRKEHENSIS